jgi:hypothetical protein
MSKPSDDPTELEGAIQAIYRGSLDAFVRQRDALAKQLRSSGRREHADQVKALRKPSRTAWTLNQVIHDDAASIERLSEAIYAAQHAQAGSGADLRTALERVRAAIRDVATVGTRASMRAGSPIDATTLVQAVSALTGDAAAFNNLRAGRLADIPEAGGLDFLAGTTDAVAKSAAIEPAASPPTKDDAAQAAARAELQTAESVLADAAERSQAAERAVSQAQSNLEAAEKQVRRAEQEQASRRAELETAREDANRARSELKQAERVIADLRRRLNDR